MLFLYLEKEIIVLFLLDNLRPNINKVSCQVEFVSTLVCCLCHVGGC